MEKNLRFTVFFELNIISFNRIVYNLLKFKFVLINLLLWMLIKAIQIGRITNAIPYA